MKFIMGRLPEDQLLLWGKYGSPIRVTRMAWPFRMRTTKIQMQSHSCLRTLFQAFCAFPKKLKRDRDLRRAVQGQAMVQQHPTLMDPFLPSIPPCLHVCPQNDKGITVIHPSIHRSKRGTCPLPLSPSLSGIPCHMAKVGQSCLAAYSPLFYRAESNNFHVGCEFTSVNTRCC